MAKATNKRSIPDDKVQENFNLRKDLSDKAKDIAYHENSSKSEVFNIAIEKFIELYEKKNGKIKPRPKAGGLKNL